jgi:1-acyl-sn-glycerol-3-phosphate acyltransferase
VKPVRSGTTIIIPRKIITRDVVRTLGRLLLPVACRIRITGRENFPKRGPLLVVGNHAAAMEAVLMLDILHTTALAKLLHRPIVLKIFSRTCACRRARCRTWRTSTTRG